MYHYNITPLKALQIENIQTYLKCYGVQTIDNSQLVKRITS